MNEITTNQITDDPAVMEILNGIKTSLEEFTRKYAFSPVSGGRASNSIIAPERYTAADLYRDVNDLIETSRAQTGLPEKITALPFENRTKFSDEFIYYFVLSKGFDPNDISLVDYDDRRMGFGIEIKSPVGRTVVEIEVNADGRDDDA